MNGIIRRAVQLSTVKSLLSSSPITVTPSNQLFRSFWNMCRQNNGMASLTVVKLQNPTNICTCGCSRGAHTKVEKELVEFLAEEIIAEKKARKLKTIPTEVDGFKVSLDGSEVSLVKKTNDETVKVLFNINHTLDTNAEPEINPQDDNPDVGEMMSKPTFSVDVLKGNQTLEFKCSFNSEPGASGADESYNDIFGIDEITLYEGESEGKEYSVAGEIIDGYLYDLLMNYLEEKGVSNEFGEKLIQLSTSYEHTAYVSLLEGLSKFTSGK